MIKVENCTGIEKHKASSLKVYPNPASDLVSIELPVISGSAEVRLLDARGQVIWIQSINIENYAAQMSLSNLMPGFYIMHVKHGLQTFAAKLIIR